MWRDGFMVHPMPINGRWLRKIGKGDHAINRTMTQGSGRVVMHGSMRAWEVSSVVMAR
jgi:hypothetical protein